MVSQFCFFSYSAEKLSIMFNFKIWLVKSNYNFLNFTFYRLNNKSRDLQCSAKIIHLYCKVSYFMLKNLEILLTKWRNIFFLHGRKSAKQINFLNIFFLQHLIEFCKHKIYIKIINDKNIFTVNKSSIIICAVHSLIKKIKLDA